MWDLSSKELAKKYKGSCSVYKGQAREKIRMSTKILGELSNLKTSLSQIVEGISTANAIGETAADYFDQGAYKDGITNYASEVGKMVSGGETAIKNINDQITEINKYMKTLRNYIKDLSNVASKWENAAKYYAAHPDEFTVI